MKVKIKSKHTAPPVPPQPNGKVIPKDQTQPGSFFPRGSGKGGKNIMVRMVDIIRKDISQLLHGIPEQKIPESDECWNDWRDAL